MIYTIYKQDTGQILRICGTDDICNEVKSDEAYIDGHFDDTLYYIVEGVPVLLPQKPDSYYHFDYVTKVWIADVNEAKNNISTKRSYLLFQSDWTQIPNGPLTAEQQQSWAVYRQELRDITSQSGYPFNVIWPTPPQG